MQPKSPSIPQDPQLPNSMDYEFLRKEGIINSQRLSGEIWTDYNEHDPGVTILEYLCYALTDLGYRVNLPLKDLLFSRLGKEESEDKQTFYPPSEVLPCQPLTSEDYRKLLIDRVAAIKNAWIEPARDYAGGIEGLYHVRVLLDDDLERELGQESILLEIKNLLHANRNLSEDFQSIKPLDTQTLAVFAEIDVTQDTIAENVLAQVLFQIEEYIKPTVRILSLEEVDQKNENLFQGPPMKNGFIRSADLKPLSTEYFVSKINEVIHSVEGVKHVRNLYVRLDGYKVQGDVIALEFNKYPVYDANMMGEKEDIPYPISLYKQGIKYKTDIRTTLQLLDNLQAQFRKSHQIKMQFDEALPKSLKKKRDLEQYYSIQKDFPLVYGIGEEGLSSTELPERQAHANQLKAYLLAFEQLMADFLAQLANTRYLFSITSDLRQSYFTGLPSDIPYLEKLVPAQDLDAYEQNLQKVNRSFDPFFERRNKFLDHLLARFGENLLSDTLLRIAQSEGGKQNEDTLEVEAWNLLQDKIRLLQDYVKLSRERGKGFNFSLPSWGTTNISGFKNLLCIHLNIKNTGDKPLANILEETSNGLFSQEPEEYQREVVNVALEREEEEDINIHFEQIQNIKIEDEGQIQFSSEHEDFLQFVFRYGMRPQHYEVVRLDDERMAVLFHAPQQEIPLQIGIAQSEEKATKLIEKLTAYLQELNEASEGFHVVEHVLLRPIQDTLYGFRVFDADGISILGSYELTDMETQRFIVDDLLITGTKRRNYRIGIVGDRQFKAMLMDDAGQLVAQSERIFDSEMATETFVDSIIDFLESFRSSGVSINPNLEFYSDRKKGFEVEADFYSLRMSMILPNWVAKFQNEDFLSLMYEKVGQLVPTHIKVDYIWLDIFDMQEFEECYQKWLDLKIQPSPQQPLLDEVSFELVKFLKKSRGSIRLP